MDFKIVFKDTCLADLGGILQWIAPQDQTAARKLGDEVVSKGRVLYEAARS